MLLGSEHEHVGLDALALQFLHGVLGGFGLQFAGSLEIGHEREVYAHGILAQFPFHLADGLQEGGTLNVTDGAANLGNHEIVVILLSQQLDVAFDFVGNMWNHLDW